MGCACSGGPRQQFLWYDPVNSESLPPQAYRTEVEAKAKVFRKGGTYIPYDGTVEPGVAIQRAETAKALAGS